MKMKPHCSNAVVYDYKQVGASVKYIVIIID